MRSRVLFSTLLLTLASGIAAETGERGKLFIQSFPPAVYHGTQQVWDVAQSRQGIIYAANNVGILEYDGSHWRTIDAGSEVRSLAVAEDGTIFVGATGQMGYLEPDESGTPTFVSLLDRAPAEARDLGRLRQSLVLDGDIYFRENEHLLRWRRDPVMAGGGELRLWKFSDQEAIASLDHVARVDGRLLLAERTRGVLELHDDLIRPVPGGDQLAGHQVRGILELAEDRLLICTSDSGLFVMRGENVRPWRTPAGKFAEPRVAIGCSRLADGRLAITTLRGGVALIDEAGNLLRVVDSASGLAQDGVLNAAFEDREGGVWLPLQFGLARIEPGSGLEFFDRDHGLGGPLTALARHRGRLFVGSTQGLFSLQPASSALAQARFEATDGIQRAVWDLEVVEGRLLAATTLGVYEVGDDRAPIELSDLDTRALAAAGDRVYLGTRRDGLHSLVLRQGRWVAEGRMGATVDDVRGLAVDAGGRIWTLGYTPAQAAVVERLDPAADGPGRGTRFGAEDGLPEDPVLPLQWRGELWVAADAGLYRFDPRTSRFEQDLEPTAGLPYRGFTITSPRVHQGFLWYFTAPSRGALVRADGRGPPRIIRAASRIDATDILDLHAEDQGAVVWAANGDGSLVRAGGILARSIVAEGETLARDVEVSYPGGSTLLAVGTSDRVPAPTLEFADYSIRFRYSLPRFDATAAHRFQSRLVGLESEWSSWSNETYRDFTALREGSYRFEVRGRDIYGTIGAQANFAFRILPPWHRTWWAYALYAIALAAAVFVLVRWRLGKSRQRVRLLAKEIQERQRMTAHIEQANLELERGESERTRFIAALEARNREMEAFVYTVSHDLKSPLVTISGFLGMLEQDLESDDQERAEQDIERIRTAVRRLQENLDGLLELSRLGLSVGEAEEIDLGQLAIEAGEAHTIQLERRETRFEIAPDLPTVYGDRARILGVLRNLIDNAIKFGPSVGGLIRVSTLQTPGETTVSVEDNGVGIEPRYHDKIFGIFDRLDPRAEGAGIGLAHAKRTIETHGGRIWVESQGLGHGCCFRFTLPARARSPLAPRPKQP